MIRLGHFELEAPIGQGGMGAVWRGHHVEQGVPVAVKVLTGRGTREPRYIEAFRREVQAVATLDHPNIIMLFDHGEVSIQAQAASGGRLTAGSPYLVMELSSQGSLDQHVGQQTWPEIKDVLLAVLEALAHAHARGVIHRDIKPANVLMGGDLPSRPELKLTDFGIAHAVDAQEEREGTKEQSAGTPHYMAPEQFEGRWRDHGPWTDLYALGCMAWELVCGRVPYDGPSFWSVAMQHMRQPPPALEATVPTPPGFERWVARLMAKDPYDRFSSAAQASWALRSLGDPKGMFLDGVRHTARLRAVQAPELGETRPLTQETLPDGPGMTLPGGPPLPGSSPAAAPDHGDTIEAPPLQLSSASPSSPTQTLRPVGVPVPTAPRGPEVRPPLPESWERRDAPGPSMQLVGTGLALYGLRTIPLVGRQLERDRVWSALRRVHTGGHSRGVLLHGAAGHGTSRLAGWLCERAQEVGAATLIRGSFGPRAAHGEGVARMVARHLNCQGLTRAESFDRIQGLLRRQGVEDPYEWSALTELLHPGGEGPGTVVRFASPRERHVLVARLLEREARRQGLILWLDDVHWSSDALALVEVLMERQADHPCPLLVLMTATDEVLAERPEEASQIRALVTGAQFEDVPVGPLPVADRAALIEELLGLGGELAQRVEQRTGGNPAFAVQLIGDWVQRGVLEVGPTGFRLKPGARADLPDTLHEAWQTRLERLLSRDSRQTLPGLELAAALGQTVRDDEWREACRRLGLTPPDIRETLEAHRMAEVFEGGWSFTQGMLRESLERTAAEAGRWQTHNAVLALMLAERAETPPERLGRHLLAAGDPTTALEHLSRGVGDRLDASDYRAAADLLRLQERALEALAPHESDARWSHIWTERARVHVQRGNPAEAIEWAARAQEHAQRHGHPRELAHATRVLAHAARAQGDAERASALYDQAIADSRRQNDLRGVADCMRAMAQMRGSRQSRAERIATFEEALIIYRKLDDPLATADCLRGLSQLTQAQGDMDRSARLNAMAQEHFEALGNRLGLAHCLNANAEIARYRGDLDEAERGYRRALALYEAVGSGATTLPQLNLALVLLARGRYAESRRLFEKVRAILEKAGRKVFLGAVHANLLPTTAAMGDWAAWDHHHAQAVALLGATNLHDADIAWPAQLAGDLALEANDPHRAREAYALALAQWQALKDDARAAEVQAALRALGHPT